MSSSNYLFSVIIPTYNRANEIEELLKSLALQTLSYDKFEIIIVDDGSTDNTKQVIKNIESETNRKVSFFKQDHNGPGKARNLGMSKAKGKYFVFIDSDCIADPNWLTVYKEVLKDKEVAGFGGPDRVLDSFLPVQKAIDYSMTSFITTGGIRGHSKKKISKYYPRSFNMGVRATIVDEIGGMGDLRHGQDIEFSHRVLSTGEPVIKVDDAIVYHKRRIGIKKFFKQVFNWGVARVNLYKIDKGMLELVHVLPSLATLVITLVLILSFFFPHIYLPLIGIGLMVLLSMAIHSIFKYKDFRVFFYVPIIVPIQVLGYGTGFLYAFMKRVILKKEGSTGFVKNYYK